MVIKNLIFINSHPIQYFAPLYKYINEAELKTEVWYCSDESIKGGYDKQFSTKVKWDIPLLDGYEYRFFKNYSWKPSHFNGFFGLINFGMVKALFKVPKSVVVVHGWHYFTHLIILLIGKIKGHTICLRCEMPQNQEILKKGIKQNLKKVFLKYFLFPRIHNFLYIGVQNKLFYLSHGIKSNQLLFCPYCVDNTRFSNDFNRLTPNIGLIKEKLFIPIDSQVILFAGKYISKKRPMDILKAFAKINNRSCWLVMVGEGELRIEMEEYIKNYSIRNVLLTGFINQSKISEYYSISNIFSMCSDTGETWGLSVNEAMNFDLPLVISDQTGCTNDLVIDGVNGFIHKTGDIDDLRTKLEAVLNGKLTWTRTSKAIVDEYSFRTITNSLKTIVNND